MKILVMLGSADRVSNTGKITESFVKGLQENGQDVDTVCLGELQVADCRGCGACQKNGNKCVIMDDMQELFKKFEECEMVVLASPLYFWTISGRLKCFIDRLYAISTEDKYPEKKTALLMTSGDDKTWTFDHAISYYHMFSRLLGGQDMGTCLIGDCTGCEDKRKLPEDALEKAYTFGKTI